MGINIRTTFLLLVGVIAIANGNFSNYSGGKNKRHKPDFPYKIGSFKKLFRAKIFENCLFLLRVKQHIQGEHKLKFWLKNIHEFQNCCIPLSWFHLLPNKNRSFYLTTCAVLKFVNIFEPKLLLYVYLVWPLERISNSQTFLSLKSLLKCQFCMENRVCAFCFFHHCNFDGWPFLNHWELSWLL